MDRQQKRSVKLSLFLTLFAWSVLLMGALVRLSDAGLGCPDWPTCYGYWITPTEVSTGEESDVNFDFIKAWKEMLHRYIAGFLGLGLLYLAYRHWRYTHHRPYLASSLVVLVIFQAALGMWTVTLLLKPVIVMLHLLGGMTILSLLWWLTLRQSQYFSFSPPVSIHRTIPVLTSIALFFLIIQIALGGWVSANYAALICPDFPRCQAQWLPPTDFQQGFTLWHTGKINYEGGILSAAARTAIHLTHRMGAVILTITLLILLWQLWQYRHQHRLFLLFIAMISSALVLQLSLGIANILLHLPLAVAVAHQGGAALLLLSLLTLLHSLYPTKIAENT